MRREYSEATKGAVMAALLAGQSLSSAAKEYKIPKSTLANWSADARKTVGGSVPNVKKNEIGELLLGYLCASLQTLKLQVEAFGDKTWIAEQPANELAVLHGVIADKSIRLLEALSSESEESNDEVPE